MMSDMGLGYFWKLAHGPAFRSSFERLLSPPEGLELLVAEAG